MTKKKTIKTIKDYTVIITGTLLIAIAFNMFFIPTKIAPGGLSGISTMIHYLLGFPVGTVLAILNIPVFIIGFTQMGRQYAIRSLIGMLLLSLFIDFIPVPHITENKMLAGIYGGLLMGTGLGLVFRNNASTGGSDIIARVIHKHLSSISIGGIAFSIDCIVITSSALVFGLESAMFAIISVFISAKVMDIIIDGLNRAKAYYIISSKSNLIVQRIFSDLNRGATLLSAKGAYSGNDNGILLCVVRRWETQRLKKLVREIDANAFVFSSDIHEVLGEGFVEFK